jgi:hypothetical protein
MVQGPAFDTLLLRFSEPVAPNSLGSGDLFVYRMSRNDADVRFDPAAAEWNAARDQVGLVFPSGSPAAPRSGYLIRILDGPGRLADAAGNAPGADSRFRLITGVKRAEIKTVTLKHVDPDAIDAISEVFTATHVPASIPVEEVVDRTGRLGHLIKVDLGDYAQADDFTAVDPAKVSLEYQVGYFTNLGIPVASQTRSISCQDGVYGGDCRAKRGYLFIGWNFTTLQRQRVATGAYVVRLQYKVRVAGTTPVSGKLDEIWGVIREK